LHNGSGHFQFKRKANQPLTDSAQQAEISQLFEIDSDPQASWPVAIEQPLIRLASQSGEYVGLSVEENKIHLALAGEYIRSLPRLAVPITDEMVSITPIPRFEVIKEIVHALIGT